MKRWYWEAGPGGWYLRLGRLQLVWLYRRTQYTAPVRVVTEDDGK